MVTLSWSALAPSLVVPANPRVRIHGQRSTRRHTWTNRRNQMEAPATAGAHRHRGGLNLPLEVAKETASGGGTHFALF